jgi:hypothetical protein
MFAPYWLIVWAWNGTSGMGVTAVPMPSKDACEVAVAAMPGSMSFTPAQAFCIPGGG